jgi:hypothetical protein
MLKVLVLPKPLSAAALSLLALAALAFPASSLAGPLTFLPSSGTFPKTTAGSSSPSQEFEVTNEGEEEVSIETIVVEGPDSADFNLNGGSCAGNLATAQHCTLGVTFVPSSVGEKQAMLSLHFNEGSEQTLALSGTAVPPQLTFTPGSYDYGVQPVDSDHDTSFQLENTGEAAVQVETLEIFGPGSSAFVIGGGCSGLLLNPNESCALQIFFNPLDAVVYPAQVRASAAGTFFAADLAGTGGRPVVGGSPNPTDFGAATVGVAGAIRTITLTNSGNLAAPAYFIGAISGGDAGSFRLLGENCTTNPLGPAASCTADVRFAPVSAGAKTARLSFLSEANGGVQVTLTGKGTAAAVTFAPSRFGFGPRAVGTKSHIRLFAIRNEGGTSLDLGDAVIAGPNLDQFVLSGDTCTGVTLGAGEECRLRVRFAPGSRGAKAATLRIDSDAGAFTASLGGRGTHARHRPRHRRRHRKTLGAIHPG